jgi:hypothetical protein
MPVPPGTACLLALQPGHEAKVLFSPPSVVAHAQALHLDLFGDMKNSKIAASKSLKEKRQAKNAKAGRSDSSPMGTSITK